MTSQAYRDCDLPASVARAATQHRSPNCHSGSGAGLWLANSPSPQTSTFPPAEPKPAARVFHFSAELARRQKTSVAAVATPSAQPSSWPDVASDEDVDLDLSFDYISRFSHNSDSANTGAAITSCSVASTDVSSSQTSLSPAYASSPTRPTYAGETSSPTSSKVKGMKADAAWDNRRKKTPPTPLSLSVSGSSSHTHSSNPASNRAEYVPVSQVEDRQRTPSPLPVTPLSSTRRGRTVNDVPRFDDCISSGQSVLAQQAASSSSMNQLRRTPTSIHVVATPVSNSTRPRSASVRSFRSAAVSGPGAGPPPFPPPTTPLPSPALASSFRTREQLPFPALHDSERRLSSLDSSGKAVESGASPHTSAEDGSALLQRYERLTGSRLSVQEGNALGIVSVPASAPVILRAAAVAMQPSATGTSTSSSAMTWTHSEQSTPSMPHSPLTPFTPFFGPDQNLGASASALHPKTSSAMPTIVSASSSAQFERTPTKGQQTQTRPAKSDNRGDLTTEQWILTQRQRKTQHQRRELATADDGDARLSVLATLAESRRAPPMPHLARNVSSSSSVDENGEQVRETLIISTVSTPEKDGSSIKFTSTMVPAALPSSFDKAPQSSPMNRWSRESVSAPGEPASEPLARPMTRARSGTTGPWAQSPLLLSSAEPSPTFYTPNLALSEDAASKEQVRTPNLDALLHSYNLPTANSARKQYANTMPTGREVGLGLDFSGAPLLPHFAIDMAPSDQEVPLQPGAYHKDQGVVGLGLDLSRSEERPSPALANDGRSPRFASDVPDSRVIGTEPRYMQEPIRANRVEVDSYPADPALHASKSIASSISAYVYNPTPASEPTAISTKASVKHASIWRRTSRPRLGVADDNTQDSAQSNVHFVDVDLTHDGRLPTSVNSSRNASNTSAASNETSTSIGSERKAQWVNKFWNALSPVVPSDVENQQNVAENDKPSTAQRNVSRGSMRPLSLIANRQMSAGGTMQNARGIRFPSPTPGAEDDAAERDARQVALRLLSGTSSRAETERSSRLVSADSSTKSVEAPVNRALHRMSVVERKAKRSSGIGYITEQRSVSTSRQSVLMDDASLLHDLKIAAEEQERSTSRSISRNTSLRTKRVSVVFGGKERMTSANLAMASLSDETSGLESSSVSAAAFVYAKVQERTAMLDSILSPRIADSPTGCTPRMTFEPTDWQRTDGAAQSEIQKATDHIPLLLNASATVAQGSAVEARSEGLTVSELHRAKREMRKLASQGNLPLSSDDEEQRRRIVEASVQQPKPSATGMPTSRLAQAQYQQNRWSQSLSRAPFSGASHGLQHRRTRTARFAPNVETFPSTSDITYHDANEEADNHGPVSIFTRSRSRNSSFGSRKRQQSISAQEVQYAAHTNYAHFGDYDQYEQAQRWTGEHGHLGEHHYHGKLNAVERSDYPHDHYGNVYSARISPHGETGGTTSKNLFWAGFLGMPWLWLIGGWYLAIEDGRLKSETRFPRYVVREDGQVGPRNVDIWTHEPSMLHQQREAQAQFSGLDGDSHFGRHQWEQSHGSGFGLGSTADLTNGNGYAPSWTTATTGTFATLATARTANTTSSDPNRTPAHVVGRNGKLKKLKGTKSFGGASLLFDTTPQVSFYQSPMRVIPQHGHIEEQQPPTTSSSSSSLTNFGLPQKSARMASGPTAAQTMLAFRPASMSPATNNAVVSALLRLESWSQLERYVLLNRLASLLAGVLVLSGFSVAVYAVIANF